MPRKPTPTFTRTVLLPFGKIELTVTGNPLMLGARDRATFNVVVDQIESLDAMVKQIGNPGNGSAIRGAGGSTPTPTQVQEAP